MVAASPAPGHPLLPGRGVVGRHVAPGVTRETSRISLLRLSVSVTRDTEYCIISLTLSHMKIFVAQITVSTTALIEATALPSLSRLTRGAPADTQSQSTNQGVLDIKGEGAVEARLYLFSRFDPCPTVFVVFIFEESKISSRMKRSR